MSAQDVREALVGKGYAEADLPKERTLRDILKRMNYRLKRIQKAKPLKKTKDTNAIFANVQAAKEEAQADPATLELSLDTKAKVNEGDYARGGKNPDGLERRHAQGLGPRPASETKVDAAGNSAGGDWGVDVVLRVEGNQRFLGRCADTVVAASPQRLGPHQAAGDLFGQWPQQLGAAAAVSEAADRIRR